MTVRLLALLVTLTLAGCAAMSREHSLPVAPQSQYDAVIMDPATGTRLTPDELAARLADSRVVIIGEYHGHHASHLLQAQLQQALYRQHPQQVLSMEQFERDHQQELDRYLAGDLGETEMIEDARAWNNYRGSYRPLVEFARQHRLPVVAANAPADIVRCVGRLGPDWLQQLPPAQQPFVAAQPFLDTPAYEEKFVRTISGSHSGDDTMNERLRNSYHAQLLRDNTMAESILQALQRYPGHQVLHTTGTFHSEERLGTVALLLQRAPRLKVTVISPVIWPPEASVPPLDDNRHKGDYLYFIQPPPDEFRDPQRARQAMQEKFRKAAQTDCS